MILHADIAIVGPQATEWLIIKLTFGNGVTFGVVGYQFTVHINNCARAIQRNFHRVPLRAWPAGFCMRFAYGIKRTGYVVIVLAGCFRVIIYLHLVAVI